MRRIQIYLIIWNLSRQWKWNLKAEYAHGISLMNKYCGFALTYIGRSWTKLTWCLIEGKIIFHIGSYHLWSQITTKKPSVRFLNLIWNFKISYYSLFLREWTSLNQRDRFFYAITTLLERNKSISYSTSDTKRAISCDYGTFRPP